MSGKKNAVCEICGAEGVRPFPCTSFCPVCQKWTVFIPTNTTGKKKKAVEEPEKKTVVEDEGIDVINLRPKHDTDPVNH